MQLQKNFNPFGGGEDISIIYNEINFARTNTSIAIYDRYKISILLSDGLNAIMGNKVIRTVPNSVLFFRPDERHFGQISRPGIHSYIDIFIPQSFFDAFGSIKNAIYFLTDTSLNRINCINFDSENGKTVALIAKRIKEILKLKHIEESLTPISLILQLILLCNDCYKIQKNSLGGANIPKAVKQTMRYISENYEKKLSVKTLAEAAHCSVAYLSRIFKQYTQMTVYEYLTATRIAAAQTMLKKDYSVTEACFSCGFNDCSNFIRCFEKITGTTPLKYKKCGNFPQKEIAAK